MTNKEAFIKDIENLIDVSEQLSEEGYAFFKILKEEVSSVGTMTETGTKVFEFMTQNKEKFENMFKAKEIAEGLFMAPRSVSGTMRKLISDGYVEKIGTNPTVYALVNK